MLWRRVSLGHGEGRISTKEIGDLGEKVAREWLWASRRKVLYRNFRAPRGGEVDIVVREGRMLCFVEVKTRTKQGEGRAYEAVDRPKQQLIERGAREWLRLLGRRDLPCRYDIMEVILRDGKRPEVTLIPNAF